MAPSLRTIKLDQWQAKSLLVSGINDPDIYFQDTPLVQASLPFNGSGSVQLSNAGSIFMPNLTRATELSITNTTTQFENLKTIEENFDIALCEMDRWGSMPVITPNLTDVADVRIKDATHWGSLLGPQWEPGDQASELAVLRSIVIGPSSLYDPVAAHGNRRSFLYHQPARVRGDFNITGNINVSMFRFRTLTEVRRLFIMDNPGSWLLLDFPRLSTATSIYINGMLDTTMDPSLFPNLTHANEMIVEPWNAEFDCSQLVRLRNIRVIESLSCNGTHGTNQIETKTNGTANDTDSGAGPLEFNGITTPVAAGVGVGAGLGVLILAALVCLVLFYRRKARALTATTEGEGPPRMTKAGEPDCAALDGNQIVEGNNTCLPHQMEGAEVVEASGVQIPAEAEAERGHN
ncbi:hypothetical protein PG985_014764, partial [Apiospora marii]|uniref:uncharacterized protein n=1 Tax=Apiospora marii TaxID=335849 RepID=UPI00313073B0